MKLLKQWWADFLLWNMGYCFEHKEFACLTCYQSKKNRLLSAANREEKESL